MLLLDWEFELAGQLDAFRDESGELLTYTAWERFANPRALPLNAWGSGPFVRLTPPPLPPSPGVYTLLKGDELLYVGIASASLVERWGRRGYSVIDPRNCYAGGQTTNCHINHLVGEELAAGSTLELWFHVMSDPRSVEIELIGQLHPAWNTQGRRLAK